jgi:hypothetical protein
MLLYRFWIDRLLSTCYVLHMPEKEIPKGEENTDDNEDSAKSSDQAKVTVTVKVGFPGKP